MTPPKLFAAAVLVLAAVLPAAPQPAHAHAHAVDQRYDVSPEFKGDRLTALRVRLRLRATVGEVATFRLPPRLRDGPGMGGLTLSGARLVRSDKDRLRVRVTGPRPSLSYHLEAAASNKPVTEGQQGVLASSWFGLRAEDVLVLAEGAPSASAMIRLKGFPSRWSAGSSLSGRTRASRLGDALLLGGTDYRTLRRIVEGAPLTLSYPAALSADAPTLMEETARVLSAERHLWRTPPRPFFVGVIQLSDDSDLSGRGLEGGLTLYLGAAAPRDQVLRLIAHEALHSWISRAIGGFPARNADLEAWLNEGFTEAYTARSLLSSGLWSPEQFLEDWNLALARYGTSPVRTAPNTRILADRATDFDVNRLPYDRGRILALLWDRRFRLQTQGRTGLDDVLRAQMAEATANEQRGDVASADRLFPVVAKRLTGSDLSSDLDRYVGQGIPLTLPSDAFGACVEVVQVTQPVFDRGFDLDATLRAHRRLTALEAGGPAERAGLREGDRLLIDEVPSHDSRTALSYTVVAETGTRRIVRYRPEGRGRVSFQQVRFRADAPSDRTRCTSSLSRP